MRSGNRSLYVICRDCTLQLYLPSAKFRLRYSVDPQTLISMSKMRNGIPNRNITPRPNADARLSPKEFYDTGINQIIAIREMGVESFNDSIGDLGQVRDSEHEEGSQEGITELGSLMRGDHFGRNSSVNLRVSGSLKGRIAKTRIYGENRKSPIGLEIGEVKKAIRDFAKKGKNGEKWAEKQYRPEKNEILEQLRKLKSRGIDLHFPFSGK